MQLNARTITDPSALDWRDAPITPAWIIAGSPRARAVTLAESADGFSMTAAWECTAGRFRWHYAVDETVHLLTGSVTVTDERGECRTLVPGDVALFRAGTTFTWDVPQVVQKLAFLHRPVPRPAGLVLRMLGRVRRWLRAVPAPTQELRPAM